MSLAVQFNIHDLNALDGVTELPAPTEGGTVTKSVNTQGVVVIDAAVSELFGAFDPGSLLGARSGDFVLQTMQISSTGTFSSGTVNVAIVGPQPPDAEGAPYRFVFHTLTGPDDLFEGGKIIPAGYKLSFMSDAVGPHVVRLTLWPVARLEQISALM
ncbi:hypothetical protein DB30_02511 [Enhygromyxa salina]|uniref:Uncharacterized protein n=1 Tax=Enhygromyxa salina TaxID=215803 RepID=A0A0C2A3D2_9BACT|nr:hypothetical protein [Enhygromyxa salina]KIG17888.1 hypothetical protein DB30_02511 [Enhygromyxa salina]